MSLLCCTPFNCSAYVAPRFFFPGGYTHWVFGLLAVSHAYVYAGSSICSKVADLRLIQTPSQGLRSLQGLARGAANGHPLYERGFLRAGLYMHLIFGKGGITQSGSLGSSLWNLAPWQTVLPRSCHYSWEVFKRGFSDATETCV